MTVNSPQPDSPANVKRLTSAELMARSEEMLGRAYDEINKDNRFVPVEKRTKLLISLGQSYAILALAKLKAGPPR